MNEFKDKEKDIKFEQEKKAALNKMDEIKNIDYDLNINVFDIISKAEDIKAKKQERKEFVLFIITIVSIMISALVILFEGYGEILYTYVIVVAVALPVISIPTALIAKSKEA